jgi:hypothetical protein
MHTIRVTTVLALATYTLAQNAYDFWRISLLEDSIPEFWADYEYE